MLYSPITKHTCLVFAMTEAPVRSPFSRSLERVITNDSSATRGEKIVKNTLIGAAFTAVDLVESKAFRVVSGWVFDGKSKQLEQKLHKAVAVRNTNMANMSPEAGPQARTMQRLADEMQIQAIRDALRIHESVRSGVEFAEEELSDQLATKAGQKVMNKIMNLDERIEEHTYVKPLAENVSGYSNAIMQVFFGDKWIGFLNKDGTPKEFMGVYLAEKSANFVNPGNVEAGLRILTDIIPGRLAKKAKETLDHVLEHNEIARVINVGFNKFLLGFHVMNSRAKAVDQATAAVASQMA